MLSTDFLIDQQAFNLVVSDVNRNIQLFRFPPLQPKEVARNIEVSGVSVSSYLIVNPLTGLSVIGGPSHKLALKGDFHAGQQVMKFMKLKLKQPEKTENTMQQIRKQALMTIVKQQQQQQQQQSDSSEMKDDHTVDGESSETQQQQLTLASMRKPNTTIQTMLIGSTQEGGLIVLLPVDMLVYRRLTALCIQMTKLFQQIAGLNPMAFRTFHARGPHHTQYPKKVLDGTLLSFFLQLDMMTQWQLARAIGTTPAQICDNIKQIQAHKKMF